MSEINFTEIKFASEDKGQEGQTGSLGRVGGVFSCASFKKMDFLNIPVKWHQPYATAAIRHPGSSRPFGDIRVTKLLFIYGILRKSHFPAQSSGKTIFRLPRPAVLLPPFFFPAKLCCVLSC